MRLSYSIGNSLCTNCKHTFGCCHKDDMLASISSCEEHESENVEQLIKNLDQKETYQTFVGLCSNCELQNDCTLIAKGSIIFSCEEYK